MMNCQKKFYTGPVIAIVVIALSFVGPVWANEDNNNNNDNNTNNNNDDSNGIDNRESVSDFFEKAKYQYLHDYSPHKTFSLGEDSGG